MMESGGTGRTWESIANQQGKQGKEITPFVADWFSLCAGVIWPEVAYDGNNTVLGNDYTVLCINLLLVNIYFFLVVNVEHPFV